jgi:hypothetical protein
VSNLARKAVAWLGLIGYEQHDELLKIIKSWAISSE